MAHIEEQIMSRIEADNLRKRIMRRVYTRWLFTRKMPQVAGEIAVITFLVVMAESRVSFSSIAHNAVAASSGPASLVQFFLNALVHTTPGVKMLGATLAVLGIMVVRDLYATKKYSSVFDMS
ncbi:MAG: hypothetical protein HYW88_01140 [Candidatus Sungbacteria bacterium]|nr:hypothetical protein [Candidatus Sungbacteria bacterium]